MNIRINLDGLGKLDGMVSQEMVDRCGKRMMRHIELEICGMNGPHAEEWAVIARLTLELELKIREMETVTLLRRL